MKALVTGLVGLAAALLAALPAMSETQAPTTLRPADPQPDPAHLAPGLKVGYAYPGDVKFLTDAWRAIDSGLEPGPPLIGFDYPNTLPGEPALTSRRATRVVALIEGYMRFDEAGEHALEFWSNDGLEVFLGGARIYRFDERRPCDTAGPVRVNVPQPGWYALKAVFFQRLSTSCLLLKMQKPGGRLLWAPTDIYAYEKD